MEFDENLAAIHAYLCADGYVIKNPPMQKHRYYHIGLRNTNLVLLKDFQKRFSNYFKIKPYIVEGRCRIGSKEIYNLLIRKFGSFYSWKWKMPRLNKKLSKIWLRVFFDCEGWVTCKKHQNRHVGLESVNKIGIEQIKIALSNLGIIPRIKKRGDRNIFSLYIYGKENLIQFQKQIDFLHPAKKEKLMHTIEDFMNYVWVFPTEKSKLREFVKKIINERGRIKKGSGIARVISNKEFNLLKLQGVLKNLFNIESQLNKYINGAGTTYFELSVNKKEMVRRLINNNLLNKLEKEKWNKLKLKK